VSQPTPKIQVRPTRPEDFASIIAIGREVYPTSPPWTTEQLASHLRVFPQGQLVAVETETQRVLGMAASLIVRWDDYDPLTHWRDFTENGMFTNHDPERGRTLYGAEIMVHPSGQRRGVGSRLYKARRQLVEQLGLLRIRAGARLRGYHRHARRLSAEEYVIKVVNEELRDPTLSFQLKHGFHVLAVVPGYLLHDPESLGYAAVIEWINEAVAKPEDYAARDRRFEKRPMAGIAGPLT
jgi:ribosomal protein S18 acetylase RimI-like enzyme